MLVPFIDQRLLSGFGGGSGLSCLSGLGYLFAATGAGIYRILVLSLSDPWPNELKRHGWFEKGQYVC